jgi:predicted transcriptional regulator
LQTPISCADEKGVISDVTMTFRLDAALRTAFVAMADVQSLSAAQILRRMMRDAVEKHGQSVAHARWQQREVHDAMDEADATRGLAVPDETIAGDWRLRKTETGDDDG